MVERNCREEALRLINKHWGPAIAAFFRARHESKEILHRLGQVACDSFSYANVHLLMNSRIVEKILSHPSIPRTEVKTRTSDWHKLETINSPPVTFARLTLANLHYGPFGDLLEGPLPTDMRGYTSPCYYSQYEQLFRGPSLAAVDGAGSGIEGDAKATCAGNKTDAGSGLGGDTEDDGSVIVGVGSRTYAKSGLGGDARDDGLAVVGAENRTGAESGPRGDAGDNGSAVISAGNRTGAGSALGGDVGDDGLVVVDDELAVGDDGSAAGDDGLAADDDGSAVGIDKRMDVNDGSDTQAIYQLDGNRLDADLILTTTGDIRADLIQDFNNGVSLVVLAKSSRIVPDKHAMDSPTRILTNVINNLFGDLFLLSMALVSSPFVPFLPTPGNSGNILTTFINYMLICMQDFVPSRWPYLPLPPFSFACSNYSQFR